MTPRAQIPDHGADKEPNRAGSGDPSAASADSRDRFRELVRQYGDPVLREKARPIRRINAGIRELARRMGEIMYAVDGVGLAAPQVGESRRIVVCDVGEGLVTLVNPRIVSAEGAEADVEACLSVPGLCGEVERSKRVRVKALDLEGKEVTIDGEGYLARVLQHELDHLDGVLYTDRAYAIRSSAAEEEEDEGPDDVDDGAASKPASAQGDPL